MQKQDDAYSDRPLIVHAVHGRLGGRRSGLAGLDGLATEPVAGVGAADRQLPGASADEHADPTPRHRGEELLVMDGLELRRSRQVARQPN